MLLLVLMLTLKNWAVGQNSMDSMWGVWQDKTQSDSVRLNAINQVVGRGLLFSNPDSACKLAEEQYLFAKKHGIEMYMAMARNLQGVSQQIQGDYYRAIDYYNQSLVISDKLGDTKLQAGALNNIGIIYKEQGEHKESIDYFKKSYKLKKKIGDKMGAANSLGNIGGAYMELEEPGKALDYYNRALELIPEGANIRTESGILNNIGGIYISMKDYDKALEYLNKALRMRENGGDVRSVASSYGSLGRLYLMKKDYDRSIMYYNKSLEITKQVGLLRETRSGAYDLYQSYRKKGDNAQAIAMLELYVKMNDSVNSERAKEEIIKQQYKYQYQRQHIADSLSYAKEKELKDIEHNAKLQKEQNQRYILYGGIGALLVLVLLAYRSYSQKKKNNIALFEKNEIITKQKEIVEEKNKEITDSIRYAKRIQNAILPPLKLVKEQLEDSFILYLPKDIVAGDFYWMEPKDNKVLFAVADCTGHGVPGAMVSVVCNNGLNRSVRELGITEPGKILDKSRELVISEFEKSEDEVKDGMDIALCSLEGKVLRYAGAHNPLWIIRKGGTEVEEIKADKQPIGQFRNAQPYTTHTLELNEGDTIYLFSDGYIDQFGGEGGKKLKASKFKEMLLSIQSMAMEDQGSYLREEFENWKGELEQLDDVCVIGVRI